MNTDRSNFNPIAVATRLWSHRFIIAMLLWASLLAWTWLAPDDLYVKSVPFYAAVLLALFVLPWPLMFAGLFLGAGLALIGLLNWISAVKAELTDMPLLLPDIQIAARDPMGPLSAVKFSPALVFGTSALVIAIFVAIAAVLAHRHVRLRGWPRLREAGILAASVAASTICISIFSDRLFQVVKPPSKVIVGAWVPEGLAKASAQLGVLPFLMFTQKLEAEGSGNYFSNFQSAVAAPLIKPVVAGIAPAGFRNKADLKPNIVFVLLESTFDVNATFDIVPPVPTTFSGNYAKAISSGALHVNAIGGGTWITEFETIVGVDSRLFGLAGLYTHVSLSPRIKGSFTTYLRKRGYDTLALYPVEGNFYSSRFGYKNYGFERFIDGKTLNLKDGWFSTDTAVMAKYLPKIKPLKDRPLFAYAVMMENHSPHPCVHFKNSNFPYRFAKEADPELNCQLNEYILRQTNTEKSIGQLENHLRRIEAKTGRPYIIAMFGDHLPNTFAGANGEVLTGSRAYRHLLRQPRDRTFYQIRGSVKHAFAKRQLDISTYLLPTLVSSFVARDVNDLHLGINYNIHKICGPKLPFSVLTFHYLGTEKTKANATLQCKDMLNTAIPVYRNSILKN